MRSSAVLLFLGLAAHAIAHGDEHDDGSMGMEMDMIPDSKPDTSDTSDLPPSYFDHPDDKFLIYSHIVVMTLSWVFALPIGTAPFHHTGLVKDSAPAEMMRSGTDVDYPSRNDVSRSLKIHAAIPVNFPGQQWRWHVRGHSL